MSSWSESLRMNQVRVVRSLIAAFRDCSVGGRVVDGEARYVEVARRRDASRRLAASSAGLLAVCSGPLRASMIEHTIMREIELIRELMERPGNNARSDVQSLYKWLYVLSYTSMPTTICDDKASAIICLTYQSNYHPIRKNMQAGGP